MACRSAFLPSLNVCLQGRKNKAKLKGKKSKVFVWLPEKASKDQMRSSCDMPRSSVCLICRVTVHLPATHQRRHTGTSVRHRYTKATEHQWDIISIPWNLSLRHIHWSGQFTPKMKANAEPRLLSSLVWIDSGVMVSQYHLESFFFMNKMYGMTNFMEFMKCVMKCQQKQNVLQIWGKIIIKNN